MTDEVSVIGILASNGGELLYIKNLNSAIGLLPYLYGHILRDELPTYAYSVQLLFYQMCLQLMHIKKGSPYFSVTTIAVNADPHHHTAKLITKENSK